MSRRWAYSPQLSAIWRRGSVLAQSGRRSHGAHGLQAMLQPEPPALLTCPMGGGGGVYTPYYPLFHPPEVLPPLSSTYSSLSLKHSASDSCSAHCTHSLVRAGAPGARQERRRVAQPALYVSQCRCQILRCKDCLSLAVLIRVSSSAVLVCRPAREFYAWNTRVAASGP